MEIDLSGPDGEAIDKSADASTVEFLKGAVMRRSVFYLNRMPRLEDLRIWSPRRTVSKDEGLRQQKGDAGSDENSEIDVVDDLGWYEDLAKDEALSLEKLRQYDDAVFLENTTCISQQLAKTVSVTIEGNLNAKDSERMLSLMDGPVFPWQQVMRKGRKTPWRVFAVDTTHALCESGGTRVVSKVIDLSTVRVFSNNYVQKVDIWDTESTAAIKTLVDGYS